MKGNFNIECGDEFDKLWNDINMPEEGISITDEELAATTDSYKIKEAVSFYLHLKRLVDLWYHAKLGHPLTNLLSPDKVPREYEFQFENEMMGSSIDDDDDEEEKEMSCDDDNE